MRRAGTIGLKPGRELRPPSRERPRRSTLSRSRVSQLPGAGGQDRCCHRAPTGPPAPSPWGGWRASARTAVWHRLPGYRGRRAPPGCGCGQVPDPVRRPTHSAGRSGSLLDVPPSCGGECRNRQAWSPPDAIDRRQVRCVAGATPHAPPAKDRRTRGREQWRRGR